MVLLGCQAGGSSFREVFGRRWQTNPSVSKRHPEFPGDIGFDIGFLQDISIWRLLIKTGVGSFHWATLMMSLLCTGQSGRKTHMDVSKSLISTEKRHLIVFLTIGSKPQTHVHQHFTFLPTLKQSRTSSTKLSPSININEPSFFQQLAMCEDSRVLVNDMIADEHMASKVPAARGFLGFETAPAQLPQYCKMEGQKFQINANVIEIRCTFQR